MLLALLVASPANSRADCGQWTLQSDSFHERANQLALRGSVQLRLRTLLVRGSEAFVDKTDLSLAQFSVTVLSGAFFHSPTTGDPVRGSAERILVSSQGCTVHLLGNARLSQGNVTITGDRLEYSLEAGRIVPYPLWAAV